MNHISEIRKLCININNVVDICIAQFNWYDKLMKVAEDFRFLSGESFHIMSTYYRIEKNHQ